MSGNLTAQQPFQTGNCGKHRAFTCPFTPSTDLHDCSSHRGFQTFLFLIFQYLTTKTTMHFQLLNTDVVANGEPMKFRLAHRLYIKMDIPTVTSLIG